MERIRPVSHKRNLLSSNVLERLAEVPLEVEWFADIQNRNTRDAYRRDVSQFMDFLGIERPNQLREVNRAHVIA